MRVLLSVFLCLLLCLLLSQQATALKKETRPTDPETLKLLEGFKETDITAKDGITLKSIVFDPSPATGSTKNPLIVFISSWGMNKWEYAVPAKEYADKGYTVISYTARGFWESGGQINLAGALDMADVSTVIDWALARTNADPARVGLSGISYGGGISLLASAFDNRVKSAASMSCWTDLAESFLGNGESIRKEAVRLLDLLAYVTGEVGPELKMLFDDYFANTDLDYLYTMTKNSSAVNFLDQINQNKPAIFIANAFGDSLFTPNQFPRFYDALKGNKHLEFAPGDHAGPELPGLLGLPDQVWTRAGQWNDYYVRDAKTDTMTAMPAVVLNTINGDEIESYSSWDSVTNAYVNYQLSKNEELTQLKVAKTAIAAQRGVASDQIVSIQTGDNANINGGLAYITATVRAYIDQPKRFQMATIHRKYGAVFQSDKLQYSLRMRGIPKLSLNILPKASSNGTIIAYLLDVDHLTDEGKLITFSPWTFKNAVPGQPLTLDIDISMTSYDMPTKNKLAIVVSTHDMLFLDQNPKDVEIAFLSGSVLSIPVHS